MTTPGRGEPSVPEHDLNLLAAYAEGRLDDAERRRMTAHLGACAECRTTLAELARQWTAVGRDLPARPRGYWRAAWLPLAAALVMATIVGISVLNRPPGPASGDGQVGPGTAARPPSAVPSGRRPSPSAQASGSSTPSPGPSRGAGDTDDGQLLVKRGGVSRSTAGKTFRLVDGEWMDVAFDPDAGLPVLRAATAGERAALLERIPDLAPFAALGPRVVVVFGGTVYRFDTLGSR